jgi:pimeloyl-ACP methyl ester carboxylesterase
MISSNELAERCAADPEFRLAARYWTGGFAFSGDGTEAAVRVVEGQPEAGPVASGPGVVTFTADGPLWDAMLSAVPPRFSNDLAFAAALGGQLGGDELAYWQYYPAIARAIELMRPAPDVLPQPPAPPASPAKRFDSPVGRYVHVDLDGEDHRIYFEEAGTGIPLLMQHTAGSHGVQWRHLFEDERITDHFRLIAYDLPFHGKSVPPTGREWWAQPYRLTLSTAMGLAVAMARTLELDRPVFMGCSVGGLLALDLARYQADVFRATIAVEPALKVDGDLDDLKALWHPQVSNEYKARLMHGLTAPQSPEALRRETVWAYSCGWPPSFIGDLYFYLVDHDLREEAAAIDTDRIGVHLLTGEYDASATIEHGEAAHEAIPGSTFTVMDGIGHFPMAENPDVFIPHLLPILEDIRKNRS